MNDIQAREAKLALVTILSTAASIGVDVDHLCHLAAEVMEAGRRLVSGDNGHNRYGKR